MIQRGLKGLSACRKHGDKLTMNIVQRFNFLSANINNDIFFQWVPSHVNVCVNENADELAREASIKDAKSDYCHTFSEIASRVKQNINDLWRV